MKRLIAFLLMFSTPVMAENKLVREIDIGNGAWKVSSYMTDQNKFSHCVATSTYNAASEYHRKYLRSRSVSMILKLHTDDTFSFMLIGQDWKLTPGNSYKLDFDFNDGEHFEGTSVAQDNLALEISAPTSTSGKWFTWMAKSNWVEVAIDGSSLGKLNLKKSNEAMTALLNCFEGSKQGEAQVNSNDGSFGGGKGANPNPEGYPDFGGGKAQ